MADLISTGGGDELRLSSLPDSKAPKLAVDAFQAAGIIPKPDCAWLKWIRRIRSSPELTVVQAAGRIPKPSLSELMDDFGLAALFSPPLPESKGTAGDPRSRDRLDKVPVRVHSSAKPGPEEDTCAGSVVSSACLAPTESWEEAEDEMDTEDLYFKALVEIFIAAAYPPGKNVAVATGPGQQEAAITPSASAGSMAAGVARWMEETQSTKPSVTSGNAVAKPTIRMVPCERWTWKRQITEDGPNGLTVMSLPKKQPRGNRCLPTATAVVMESNLRVQHNKDSLLSLDHLVKHSDDSVANFPSIELPVERLFLQVQSEGVLSEFDYVNPETAREAVRYHINNYHRYKVDNPKQMEFALYRMRRGGPLMGVIKISPNYNKCAMSGKIYKYNPDLVDNKKAQETHAVCIVSFGIEDLPYLECQSTHGEEYADYLKIDVSSLCQLWSIFVR